MQSLSFVLTLPLFVMVMLFIVQLSQITIGRLAVEYAALAAELDSGWLSQIASGEGADEESIGA